MYREYLPDIRLQHLIETYWVTDQVVNKPYSEKIMPDGCVDIIFNFQEKDNFGQRINRLPNLVGTMTSLLEITYQTDQIEMLGIRFAPGGITAFTHIPIHEITNQNIELPLADTLFETEFYSRLPQLGNMDERINYINRYLITRLNNLYQPNRQIQYAVSLIKKNIGLFPIKQLAKEVCMSERNFERQFKTAIGISPKFFSNVIRFEYTRQYLKTHKTSSLFSIAIDCGYHDHSHMYKEFLRLGQVSPSDLL